MSSVCYICLKRLFIYFWLCCLCCCADFYLVTAKLLIAVASLWSTGSKGAWGLVVMACGLRIFGSWALEHRLSSCGTGAYLLCGMWDFLRLGIKLMFPALSGRSLPLNYRGSLVDICFLFLYFTNWSFVAILVLADKLICALKKKKKFTYGCVGLLCCGSFSPVEASRGYLLSCGVPVSHCGGFFYCRAQAEY